MEKDPNSRIIPMESPFPGAVTFWDDTPSTMDLARRAVDASTEPGQAAASLDGAVFWAGYQSSGRGRLEGRRWDAAPGENLLFTILISKDRPCFPISAFPLSVGLAAALTLEDWGLRPQIKWPNDLLLRGRKVAGILCETAGDYLSAGMGLNLGQQHFPPELERKACSVAQFLNPSPEPAEVLARFLGHFHRVLSLDDWRREVQSRLFGEGMEIEVEIGLPGAKAEHRKGCVEEIGQMGELILKDQDGDEFSVFSGEVILKGGYGES